MKLLKKTLLAAVAAVSASWAVTGYQMSVCGTNKEKLCYGGNEIFLSGMNVAWFGFGKDVGKDPTGTLHVLDKNAVRKAFKGVRLAGGNSVRWWLYTNNSMDPSFDANNMASGIEQVTIDNVQKVLDVAQEYGILVDICFLSFDMAKKNDNLNVSSWSRYNYTANELMLKDTTATRAYIDHAILPLVTEFKDHPALLAWEVFNEPEGMTSTPDGKNTSGSFGTNWGTELYEMKYIQSVITMVADAIHTAAPANLVTNGSAKTTMTSDVVGVNYYSDAALKAIYVENSVSKYPKGTLDFYQVHYYPEWMANNLSPFHNAYSNWNLDKPLVVGEFPAADWTGANINRNAVSEDRKMTVQAAFDYTYKNGYSGALAWTMVGGETASKGDYYSNVVWSLETAQPGMTALNTTNHAKITDLVVPTVDVKDVTGLNGQMKVTYAGVPDKTGSQLAYVKAFDFTGATSISMTVKNDGNMAIEYALVLKTGSPEWGWFQSVPACSVAKGVTKTCTYPISSLLKDGSGSAISSLSNVAEVFLVAFGAGFKGDVYIDQLQSNNGVVVNTFDEEFDLFSPAGADAANMVVVNYYDDSSSPTLMQTVATAGTLRFANGSLEVSLPQAGMASVELVGLQGKVVMTLHKGDLSAGVHHFAVGDLPKGAYIVQVKGASYQRQGVLLR